MELIKYILIGILQGITEPIPISSSGHIYILKSLFNANAFGDLSFEIFLHFASFIAILIIYFKDVSNLIKGFFSYIISKEKKYKEQFRYCMLIIVGTIPVAVAGFIIKDPLERLLSTNTSLIGFAFILTGLMLLLVTKSNGKKEDKDILFKDAIIIGLMQVIALVPGISRSGATLVGCLLCGLNKESSLKYSFMLYFPVSIASMILGVSDVYSSGINLNMLINYIIGMIASGIFTYISYKWLTNIVKNGKLWTFSIYLIIVGLITYIYFM